MKISKAVIPILLLLLFSCFSLFAQEVDNKLALVDVLNTLEKRFDVSFTYVDENIEGIKVETPSELLTLPETLDFLQANTGLLFQQLNKRFITIIKPNLEQTDICGILVDIDTEEKIQGATIQYNDQITLSDENGYFSLTDIEGVGSVSIRFLGYKTMVFRVEELRQLPCKSIIMRPNIEALQEVVLQNYITEGINKKIDGAFTANTKRLGILPGLIEPDVLQTLQALPGIQSINETVSNINVRGGTHDQNLILWDGIKIYQSGHFFGLISSFNPYLSEKVTLIKNGTSARFDDGVSSILDIRSEDRLRNTFVGGAGLNMINGDVYGKIPLSNKTTLHVSARRSMADILETPTYKQYFDRAFRDTEVINSQSVNNNRVITTDQNFYFYDFSAKFLYDITNRDKLRFNFINVYNKIDYLETTENATDFEAKTSGLIQKNLAGAVSYERDWNERFTTQAQVYFSLYNLDAVNFDIINDQRLIQENEVFDTGVKLHASYDLNNRIELHGGYQFFEVGISNLEDINLPRFRRLIKEVLRTHSGFAEATYSSDDNRTNITLGGRVNYFQKFDKALVQPRVSLNQKLSDHFSVEVLGEMKSQSTTQVIDFQNDFLGIEKRRWRLSNEADIPIVTSKQASVGLHYSSNDGLIASIDGYFKEVSDITASSQGFQDQLQFVRAIGNYSAYGIDFLVNKKFRNFSTWFSYSYAKNDYSFDDLTPSEFPNNLDITHAISFAGSYSNRGFKISPGVNWRSGRPFTEPVRGDETNGNLINYQSPNSSRLDDYLRFDLSATYTFKLSDGITAFAGASVWNLTNQTNVVDVFYRINDDDEVERIEQTSLGITPNLSLRITF